MRTFEEVQDELRECIKHAYRDGCEDIQKFGSNVAHLNNAMYRLNELVKIHKAGVLDLVISALKGFEGITYEEIISKFVERDDSFEIRVDKANGIVDIELSLEFWNSLYKAVSDTDKV